jgi:hypothetical protein
MSYEPRTKHDPEGRTIASPTEARLCWWDYWQCQRQKRRGRWEWSSTAHSDGVPISVRSTTLVFGLVKESVMRELTSGELHQVYGGGYDHHKRHDHDHKDHDHKDHDRHDHKRHDHDHKDHDRKRRHHK